MMNSISYGSDNIFPSKVVCVGRNYVDHIAELGNQVPAQMVVFNKPNSSISSALAIDSSFLHHYEAELSFLYGELEPEERSAVGEVKKGFTAVALGLDLTRRDVQKQLKSESLPWERAKAFDGSAVFSPFVSFRSGLDAGKPSGDEFSTLSLQLDINDQTVQAGGVQHMIYKPLQILAELETFMSLQPGDVVMTGTPVGVGEVIEHDSYRGVVYQGDRQLICHEWRVGSAAAQH